MPDFWSLVVPVDWSTYCLALPRTNFGTPSVRRRNLRAREGRPAAVVAAGPGTRSTPAGGDPMAANRFGFADRPCVGTGPAATVGHFGDEVDGRHLAGPTATRAWCDAGGGRPGQVTGEQASARGKAFYPRVVAVDSQNLLPNRRAPKPESVHAVVTLRRSTDFVAGPSGPSLKNSQVRLYGRAKSRTTSH